MAGNLLDYLSDGSESGNKRSKGTMGEDRKPKDVPRTEDIIAAFDRERDEANELNRRHTEQVRASRANDRPVRTDRNKK